MTVLTLIATVVGVTLTVMMLAGIVVDAALVWMNPSSRRRTSPPADLAARRPDRPTEDRLAA
jgi:hypothetical protein